MLPLPTTRKLARLVSRGDTLALELGDGPMPQPGPGEVLVRVEAASLNYRDLLVLRGQYPLAAHDGLVPLSDGAGTVAMVGSGVTHRRTGDRVAQAFFPGWTAGAFRRPYGRVSLGGGDTDGMLAEYVVAPADAVVAVPESLSPEEAATLPCAAVTAWHALMVRGGLQPGDTVLVQGTGGVALFGLQFATALGARVIVTSSSDAKLERARALGAWGCVNYRSHPDWEMEVRRLTDGEGASHILELGGAGTFDRSLACVAAGGHIAQIGVLTGFDVAPNLRPLMAANASIDGIFVGSAEHFAAMNAFIAAHGIKPVVDRVFAFDETPAAYDHLASGRHFGKVVIRL